METIRQVAFDADATTLDPGVHQQGGEIVRFYFHEVAQKDFCRIEFPGNKLSVWDQPVREKDKQKYAQQWELYKSGKSQLGGQTPLDTWSEIDQGSRDMYIANRIRTVEQLANVADVNMNGFPPGHASLAHRHREMARNFVEKKKHSVGYDKAIEAASQSQEMATAAMAENEALKAQLEELRRRMEAQEKNGHAEFPRVHKRKPGGWEYELSDGQIVIGKENAEKAQALIDESA